MALAVLLRVLQALILHPHPLVVSLTRIRLLEPVEKLRGRVRLVVVLAVGEHRQLVGYSASHGAFSGMRTKPFSISVVCAFKRMTLSVVGWWRVTPWQPSAIRSWISCVPEALSSISTTCASNRLCCSRTARLSAGYSSRRRNTPSRKSSLPFTPQVVHTEKSLSSVALLAVSQLCTMRSKCFGSSSSR